MNTFTITLILGSDYREGNGSTVYSEQHFRIGYKVIRFI